MTQDTAKLLRKALELPVAERAELAGTLIESLDGSMDDAVEAAWKEEISRRMQDVDSDKVELIPYEKGLQKLSSALE